MHGSERQREIVRYIPAGEVDYIVRPTRAETLKALQKATRRGEVLSASNLRQIPGTRSWAVKILRSKPAKKPMPTWAGIMLKILLGFASVVTAFALLIAALGLLFGSLVQLATPAFLGGVAVLAGLYLIATRTGRRLIRVVVEVID